VIFLAAEPHLLTVVHHDVADAGMNAVLRVNCLDAQLCLG